MTNQSPLSDRDKQVYNFIRDKIKTRGYGPTVREIGNAFDIQSPDGVMCHLNALVEKGLITREDRMARSVQLVGHRAPSAGLPLPGRDPSDSGAPLPASRQKEYPPSSPDKPPSDQGNVGTPPPPTVPPANYLTFAEFFGDRDLYALKVKGQSMIEDHIDDGDYVVIRRLETAENGERVVAMIDNKVTLKRFRQEKGEVWLDPVRAGGSPPVCARPSSEVLVLGVLVGVLRIVGPSSQSPQPTVGNQQLLQKIEGLEAKVAQLTDEKAALEEYAKTLEEKMRCPDCQRQRTDWYRSPPL
jgi:repressor LexA